jgi:hypothetical protein
MRGPTRSTAILGLMVLFGCSSGGGKAGDASIIGGGTGGGVAGAGGSAVGTGGGGGSTVAGSGGKQADAGNDTALLPTDGASRDGAVTSDSIGPGATDVAVAIATTCTALSPSGGTQVNVTPMQAGTLHELTQGAAAGTTFLLAPGTYPIAGSLRLEKDNLTLRSSTDRAADVIIDANYTVAEAIVVRASNVTLAHVTITHAVDHAIHASPASEGVDVTGILVYGVALTDNGEQFIKVNPLGTATGYLDQGRVECSTFLLTDAGRPHIERTAGGCYTGGIDVHAGRDWIVRGNRFEGLYCAGEGLAEHAIHFWKRSRGTLVENNVIINCARGVGFGMGDTDTGTRVYADAPYGGDLGHIDGIIRNNIIYADIDYFDTGIEIMQARKPIIVHNTVVSWVGAGFFSSLDYRFGRTQALIQDNLTRRITMRDGASGTVDHNLENTPQSYFVNPAQKDFHLNASASDAIDRGIVVGEAGLDIDGEAHTRGAPDLGADER